MTIFDKINKGTKFGKLTAYKPSKRHYYWLFNCDCGNKLLEKRVDSVFSGDIKSCGCLQKTIFNKGDKYGRLTIIKQIDCPDYIKYPVPYYLTKCDCGNKHLVSGQSLKRKNRGTKSCGCLTKEIASINGKNLRIYKHTAKHPLMAVLREMIKRCYDIENNSYKNYGGRGITVYKKWINNPDKFVDWGLENGWKKGLEIDRIDNNKNYTPFNCRFVSKYVQCNNKRPNILFKDTSTKKIYTLTQLTDYFKVDYEWTRFNFRKGKDINELLFILTGKKQNIKHIKYTSKNRIHDLA